MSFSTTSIRDGLRAGLTIGIVLALWTVSFTDLRTALFTTPATNFWLGLGVALGLVAAPQVAYGLALGSIAWIWRRRVVPRLREHTANRDGDRRVAGLLLAVPLLLAAVGAGAGAVHLFVTSSFERDSFAAAGLGLAAALFGAVAIALLPLFRSLLERLLAPLGDLVHGDDGRNAPLSRAVLVLFTICGLLGVVFAYRFAASLQVWSTATVRMGTIAAVGVPILFGLFRWRTTEGRAWVDGLWAVAGLGTLACFPLSFGWSSETPALRRSIDGDAALLGQTARILRPLADSDGDGYAQGLGRLDCDDTDPDIYPGAPEIPGNGIDESCSGRDATPPTANDHPARRAVNRAADSARRAANRRAESIPDPPRNIVMVLVDTVRYDHLGFAGYERPTSPNLDDVADDAAVFERAYAPSPHTPRSIPPLFFGKYPSRIDWLGPNWNYPKIRPDNLGLFEVLDERGWRNVGFSSHHYFEADQGIRQGFEDWNNEGAKSIAESNEDIAAPRIWEKLEPAIPRLAERSDSEPFSLFVHLFEPHAQWIEHDGFEFDDGSTNRENHIANYDSEIAYTDSYVGKIIDKLKATGLWDEVVFVVLSDHGEAFKEHGHYFHGQTLYDEVIHIPLLIRVPGWKPQRISQPVTLVDVAPTLLELVDVPIPDTFDGRSLVGPMLGSDRDDPPPVFAELLPYTAWNEHHKAVIDGDEKLIRDFSAGIEEYYDLSEDPREQDNLADSHPDRVDELGAILDRFVERSRLDEKK